MFPTQCLRQGLRLRTASLAGTATVSFPVLSAHLQASERWRDRARASTPRLREGFPLLPVFNLNATDVCPSSCVFIVITWRLHVHTYSAMALHVRGLQFF